MPRYGRDSYRPDPARRASRSRYGDAYAPGWPGYGTVPEGPPAGDELRSPVFGRRPFRDRGREPGRTRRPRYGSSFPPLHPDEPLARALREDAEDLVRDYLREESYGMEYARDLGRRTRGRGDRLRGVARRLSRGGYDRNW